MSPAAGKVGTAYRRSSRHRHADTFRASAVLLSSNFLFFFFSFRNISSCRLLPALPYTFERLLSFPKTLTSSRAHKQSRQPCFVCLPATMLFCWSVSTSSAFLRIDIFLRRLHAVPTRQEPCKSRLLLTAVRSGTLFPYRRPLNNGIFMLQDVHAC